MIMLFVVKAQIIQIGNAVPCKLSKDISKIIKKILILINEKNEIAC